jgi:protein SCO1/2
MVAAVPGTARPLAATAAHLLRRAAAAAFLSLAAFTPAAAGGAPSGADGASFDRNLAVGISQGVLGSPVGNHTLIRPDGTRRRLADYRGKPLVVSLIFTSCAHICPATTQHLKRGVREARQALGEDSFRVITVGFDSARDTHQQMADFARRQGVQERGWDFLASDEFTIKQLASDLGFIYYPAGGGFDHLLQTTVIDAEGVIYRQVYGIDFKIPHLVEPLKELVFDSRPEQSLYQSLSNRIRLFCTVYDPASDSYKFSYAIFIGLIIGLAMGAAALMVVTREWQRHWLGEAVS